MNSGYTGREYHHNHYVPEWYQRRFLQDGQTRFHYLDLAPDVVRNGPVTYTRRAMLNWGPDRCFAQEDLYTVKWGNIENTEIEQFFFGRIDGEGKRAVGYFANFAHPSADGEAFQTLLAYMTVQKLRTPKGLGHLKELTRQSNQSLTLVALQSLQTLYAAIWTECVWQIADASHSLTKFIISDHPVTVYNRACYPMSNWCKGFGDPDIRLVGTHTFFPLSLNKVLILTNLSWVRDPYQSETAIRPNPDLFRAAMFKFTSIQTDRLLTEEEVIEINYVTKRRALRYIAGAEREWLFPEQRLRDDHWRKLGDGYLFMPDPRHVHMGGEIFIGYGDGTSEAFGAYGHRPWQKGYKDPDRDRREAKTLERFKGEWAAMHGPNYRGTNFELASGNRPQRKCDSPNLHAHYLEIEAKYRARPGERQRRRGLKRKSPP